MNQTEPPIRLTLLTGFLGSGKTTILNRLLTEPGLSNTAVIVNEFGEVGVDGMIVESTSGDAVIELSDGCLCCSVRGELVDTLADLAGRKERLSRVVVETTGIADPSPILAAMMADPTLSANYVLDGVVCVVDALAGPANLAGRLDAQRQVALADRIVVTKTDLADAAALADLYSAILKANDRSPMMDASNGEPIAPAILDCGLSRSDGSFADPAVWLGTETATSERRPGTDTAGNPDDVGHGSAGRHAHGHEHGHAHSHADHHHGITSFALLHDRPIEADAMFGFLDLLRSMDGEKVLRMKAIVDLAESPERPVVLHGVRGYLHPPASLPAWPEGARRQTRLVLIGEDLDERRIRDLFAAFTGSARIDAPDRTALTDNPLAVPGYRFG